MQLANLQKGDIVTYSYEVHARSEVPVNPTITRIRTDVTWKDVMMSFASEEKFLNGMQSHRSDTKTEKNRLKSNFNLFVTEHSQGYKRWNLQVSILSSLQIVSDTCHRTTMSLENYCLLRKRGGKESKTEENSLKSMHASMDSIFQTLMAGTPNPSI